MNKILKVIILGVAVQLCVAQQTANAQGSFEEFRKQSRHRFEAFSQKAEQDYDDFRNKINEEYASMLKNAWEGYSALNGITPPEDDVKPLPPVVYPKDNKKDEKKSKQLPVIEVTPVPQNEPQPKPVVPVVEPTPQIPTLSFSFFGTSATVHFDKTQHKVLTEVSEHSISEQWKNMSTKNYDALLSDCLRIREEHQLCDWAYIRMLNDVANSICGKGTNDATLLMAYLYCQSGYKMRLGQDNGKLYMLYASKHLIYKNLFYKIDNESYYIYNGKADRMNICNVSFPKEKEMSLVISNEPIFQPKLSPVCTRTSRAYPNVTTTMESDTNLMDFYETYPTSMIGDNECSRWALYANKPMQSSVKKQIYPSLSQAISGKGELQAVNMLLNYVQTGFEYEYDNTVWGCDRAFFAEESLYYPYCDCEDRSILFTRLVRDLLHLPCILVYYPGHLAAAVCFNDEVNGDYIMLDNRRFTISDPTYINAPVGKTMPNMDNTKARVILLE